VRGVPGISVHWHLYRYFFMFACLKGGDDRLRQPPDEARPGRWLHPVLPDQLKQRLAQRVVLPEERPRVHIANIHQELHRADTVELDPWSPAG
jgi:hypothetical protein